MDQVAGLDTAPGAQVPSPWEGWDPATPSAEGDEGRRRWLVASSGRQCLLNEGRDRVEVTTQVWSAMTRDGAAAATVSLGLGLLWDVVPFGSVVILVLVLVLVFVLVFALVFVVDFNGLP